MINPNRNFVKYALNFNPIKMKTEFQIKTRLDNLRILHAKTRKEIEECRENLNFDKAELLQNLLNVCEIGIQYSKWVLED